MYICNMSMAKFKPYRIMILQKNLFPLWWTIGFARNLKNTVEFCLGTRVDTKNSEWEEKGKLWMLLHEHICFPPCSANHDTWHHKSIHVSQELSTKSEQYPQCKHDCLSSWWLKNGANIPDQQICQELAIHRSLSEEN